MSAKTAKGTPGDLIFTKVSVLVFLGVFLMGLGAELPLWTAVYRAFFVWLVVSLMGGGIRVAWKYHLYHQREQELHANINRAREEEGRILQERRQKRGPGVGLLGVLEERQQVAARDDSPAGGDQ